MKKLLLALLLPLYTCVFGITADNKKLIDQLDKLLANTPELEMRKEMHLQQLKAQAASVPQSEQRYWILRDILNEYSVFDSDSALAYGQRALEAALSLGRTDLANDIHIINSYTLAATGLLAQSRDELEKVDLTQLNDISRIDYMGQNVYLITHESQFKNVTGEQKDNILYAQSVLDSIARSVTPSHPDYYYHIGYHALSQGESAQQAIDIIEPAMQGRAFDTREDAKLAWVLSQLYKKEFDDDMHMRYLILSAQADARTANRDIASLEELSQVMQQQGDLDHAYLYIDHTLQSAELLRNRVRVLHVAMLQREISKLYQERALSLQRQREAFLIIMGVLIVVLILALVYIMRQRSVVNDSNAQLAKLNDELKARLEELSTAYSTLASNNQRLLDVTDELRLSNERLAESDIIKVKCIGTIFGVCSTYINKLDDFRKQISRKLKAKQYDEARQLTESHEQTQAELKEFYKQFDSIFLSVYPDFVSDFNALLPPDEQITTKNPESLNTELRIYALVRLGVIDSVKIAAVLHCSPQTIYNKRQRIRNVSGLSKEELVKIVRNLGKASIE